MKNDIEIDKSSVAKREDVSQSSESVHQIDTAGKNASAKLANPLEGIPREMLLADAARFAEERGLPHLVEAFQKGALVAQDPAGFEELSLLTEEDKVVLRREVTHRWKQPFELYYLVVMCSLAAAVQGVGHLAFSAPTKLISIVTQMDESVINGANLFYAPQFGIDPSVDGPDASRNQWLLGLVNSAPYVSDLFMLLCTARAYSDVSFV